jgi:hypothetical protein
MLFLKINKINNQTCLKKSNDDNNLNMEGVTIITLVSLIGWSHNAKQTRFFFQKQHKMKIPKNVPV